MSNVHIQPPSRHAHLRRRPGRLRPAGLRHQPPQHPVYLVSFAGGVADPSVSNLTSNHALLPRAQLHGVWRASPWSSPRATSFLGQPRQALRGLPLHRPAFSTSAVNYLHLLHLGEKTWSRRRLSSRTTPTATSTSWAAARSTAPSRSLHSRTG